MARSPPKHRLPDEISSRTAATTNLLASTDASHDVVVTDGVVDRYRRNSLLARDSICLSLWFEGRRLHRQQSVWLRFWIEEALGTILQIDD
ncbi:unnamed protein product [Linum tenue]|uniref:Uncharacterized protein n=1 Tax=Linum tenue TaxID=586396 RepID=A0AAV0NV48_9ROSI|nr:unnamed protein product [Linum tenue]